MQEIHAAQCKTIVVIHNHTKALNLLAEELDRNSQTFLQPVREQYSAHEHIIRAWSVELDIAPPPEGMDKDDCLQVPR